MKGFKTMAHARTVTHAPMGVSVTFDVVNTETDRIEAQPVAVRSLLTGDGILGLPYGSG